MKTLFLLIAASLYADDAKPPEPQITPEEQHDWQRARADMLESKASAEAAAKAYQDKTNELARKCGDRQLVKNAAGDPACTPRAPEKK